MRFRPRGDRSHAEIVYTDLAAPAQIGEVITYEAIREATGCRRDQEHAAIERVKNRLLEEQHCSLAAIPGKGYMKISGGAVVRQGIYHLRKEFRQVSRALTRFHHVDRNTLMPGERDLADEQEQALARRLDAGRQEQRRVLAQQRLLDLVRLPHGGNQ